jgi:PAS domain S-box-containing protein
MTNESTTREQLESLVRERTAELARANEQLKREIEERKRIEEHIRARSALFRLLNETTSRREYLDSAVKLIREWSGCCCVGIRVIGEGGKIPYASYVGFSREFWESENEIVIGKDQCICTRVSSGSPEPQDRQCMTLRGSFCSGDTGGFLASLSPREQARFRGACLRVGFGTICVIPVRYGDAIVGAIHMADKEPNALSAETVDLLESLAPVVGEAIHKFDIKDALKRSQQLIEKTFLNLDDAIFIAEASTRGILKCNASAGRMFGYNTEEVKGKSMEFLHVSREMFQEFGRRMTAALERDGVFRTEYRMRRKDGSTFPSEHSVTELLDEDGNRFAVVGVIRDISERKRVEEQLKTYMKRIEQSNAALQDFASIASHDMQEPLRKIVGFGDRLKRLSDDSLSDKARDYIDRMQKAANRMQALLKALLDYSRITTRAEPFSSVRLTELVHEVIEDLEVRILETGGRVEVGNLPAIDADYHQMRQLFQNLIGNALKYHKDNEKPLVMVYGESIEGEEAWRIVVEDNGIGFDEKHAAAIFSPFQRLHGRSSSYEGTGMGLAICKKIVERHGGTISAKSTPGSGSVFSIILPLRQSESEASQAAASV